MLDQKKMDYFYNVANKLQIVLSREYRKKKKKLSIYATKEDLYHDLILYYLEFGDEGKAESKVMQKYLNLLKKIAVERSWDDEQALDNFVDREKDEV